MLLVRAGISGWRLHPKNLTGHPDFVFESLRIAIFVDGCFWHQCPRCRLTPSSNLDYWMPKLRRNRERDWQVRLRLNEQGWLVLRIWEHELNVPGRAIHFIRAAISKRGGC